MKKSKMLKVIATILMLTFMIQMVPFSAIAAGDEITEVLDPESIITEIPYDTTSDENPETKEIVSEETAKRSENEKHFKLEDGSFVIAQYPDAVHYEDENGNWVDIDNTLIAEEATDANDFDGYTNKDNDFNVKLAENGKDQLLRIEEDGFSISMKLDEEDAAQSFIAVENNNNIATITDDMSVEEKNDQTMQLDKLTSKAEYSSILPGIDIEYTVQSNGVKEYIVVNEHRDEYIFSFELELENLVVRENEDGSVSLMTSDGEEKYVIPAPYMFDANEQYSDAVTYDITNIGSGKYTMTVTADDAWINTDGTVLPVKIDPTITTKETTVTIQDTFVSSKEPTESKSHEGFILVGTNSTYGTTHAYVNWTLPDTMYSSYVVTSAKLNYYLLENDNETTPVIIARQVTNYPSDETGTKIAINNITWDKKPTHSEFALDNKVIQSPTQTPIVEFDITKAVYDDCNNGTTNGIVLMSSNEDICIEFASINNLDRVKWPTMEIYYNYPTGLDSEYSYIPFELSDIGTAYVNVYNGDVSYIHNTIATSSLNIKHVFNPYMANIVKTDGTMESFSCFYQDMSIGDGWKLSIQDKIVPISEKELSGDYTTDTPLSTDIYISDNSGQYAFAYVYNNHLGTNIYLHYFEVDDTGYNRIYKDQLGLGYELQVKYKNVETNKTDANGNTIIVTEKVYDEYVLTTPESETKTFGVYEETINNTTRHVGYISQCTSSTGSTLQYHSAASYDPTLSPSQITTLSGPLFAHFSYDMETNRLASISAPQKTISFVYGTSLATNNKLVHIDTTTFSGGFSRVTFNYNMGRLASISDGNGNSLTFEYRPNGGKIESVKWTKSGSSDEIETTFDFEWRTTAVHYPGITTNGTVTNEMNLKFSYNDNGNGVTVFAQNAQGELLHEMANNNYKGINHIAINNPEAHITDFISESLVAGSSNFTQNTNTNTSRLKLSLSEDAYSGDSSYKLTSLNGTSAGYMKKDLILETGTHTFSAYVKCPNGPDSLEDENSTSTSENSGIILSARNSTNTINVKSNYLYGKITDWRMVSISITVDENITDNLITLSIGLENDTGYILVDDISIDGKFLSWPIDNDACLSSGFEKYGMPWETSEYAMKYVTNNAAYATDSTNTSYEPENVLFDNYSLVIDGELNKEKSIYQTYYLNYATLDSDYVLSGWGKAESLPLTDPSSIGFELFAYYIYRVTNEETKESEFRTVSTAIPFNWYDNDWQYVSQKLITPELEEGENFTGLYSVTIGALYKGNTGTAYFDNIELTKITK